MWLVDPKLMCQKHLCGEHVEIHMFISHISKHRKITGFINNNLIQLSSICERHEELVNEMLRRGYRHNSQIDKKLVLASLLLYSKEERDFVVDVKSSHNDLVSRCSRCKKLYFQNWSE